MHNKLQIPNLHIIMYLSGKKEQMLRKVISQLLDTPVPSPGLFSFFFQPMGKYAWLQSCCFLLSFHCFTVLLQCVPFSSVSQNPVWPALSLSLSLCFSAAFYPVLLLIIAQITYRDTFFFRRRTKISVVRLTRRVCGYN